MMPSRWIKCLTPHGNLRAVLIDGTLLIGELARLHGLKGPSAQAFGQAVLGALGIASYCKTGERVNLNARGSGRIFQALVDASPEGSVRGYAVERTEGTPQGPGVWGTGVLSILRTKSEEGHQPYIGSVELTTGELADALSAYWHRSEQVPTALGLEVATGSTSVLSAGAVLVQALPNATAEELRALSCATPSLAAFARRLPLADDPVAGLNQALEGLTFEKLEERALKHECACSAEKVNRALVLAGAAELKGLLEQQGDASVRCDFCTKTYTIARAQLEALIGNAKG